MPEPPLPGDRFEAGPPEPAVRPAQPEPPDALRARVAPGSEPSDAVRPQGGAARR